MNKQPAILRLSFPASLNCLADLGDKLHQFLYCCTTQEAMIYETELVITEIITNIIKHGVGQQQNQIINMEIKCEHQLVDVTIDDQGKPIPIPILNIALFGHFEEPDINQMTLLPEHGLGMLLIGSLVESFDYQITATGNRFSFNKRLSKEGS